MQFAQHGQRCLAVELADVPIVAFEDQLAGEKDAVRKVLVDLLS